LNINFSSFIKLISCVILLSFSQYSFGAKDIISPGDSLSIKVFGEPDLSLDSVKVTRNGTISFPLLGEIKVSGYGPRQLENRLNSLLSDGYLLKPDVSVSVVERRPFFVKGAVESPGFYPFSEGITVEKGIILAGGFSENADKSLLSIVRESANNQEILKVQLHAHLQPGDIIDVGEKDAVALSKDVFYVHGEVRKPGEYKYKKGLTVNKAIVLAGGFTKRASKRKINITREISREEKDEIKTFRAKVNLPVQPGDIIDVGQSLF